MFIEPTDLEARVELLKVYMQDRPQSDIDWLGLAEQCEYHTSAELEYVVNEAARVALSDRRLIADADILTALGHNPASLTADAIEQMRKF